MAPLNSPAQFAAWGRQSPESAGFAPDLSSRLDALISDKRAWNVHGVLVARGGKLILERYFEGTDWQRGQSLGHVAFGPDTLHDLRSVSKSIVGLLYGIALEQGKVPPPDAPLLDAFPAHGDLATDPTRARWTVHHALTMTMGTDWDELGVPYTDPTNSEIEMDRAPDRYRYVLGRPVVSEPGTRWVYSGGATALLGRMIALGTGRSLHAFAREALFDPLGVGASEWLTDAQGEEFAASGLRLRPRDLLRIGELVLRGGEIGGRRIVSGEWMAAATRPYVSCDEVRRYGYQWYMGDMAFSVPSGPRWNRNRLEHYQGAYGNGGQRLWVFPGIDLVVAVTAGNYDVTDQWVPSLRVLREAVLASVL